MGYQQSLRGCQGGLMLNMDTAASAFLMEQPMLAFLLRSCQTHEPALYNMDATLYRKADRAIKNIKVLPCGRSWQPVLLVLQCPADVRRKQRQCVLALDSGCLESTALLAARSSGRQASAASCVGVAALSLHS